MRKLTHVYLKKVSMTFLILLAISFATVISSYFSCRNRVKSSGLG